MDKVSPGGDPEILILMVHDPTYPPKSPGRDIRAAMDEILPALAVRAALASGWPRLWVSTASELGLIRARTIATSILGPLPQADELIPFAPSGSWELRVDLPGLEPLDWIRVRDALAAAGLEGRLEPADPLHVTEALDRGWLIGERHGPGLDARLLIDPEGGAVRLDLRRVAGLDPALEELEAQIVARIRAVDPALQLRSDRGPDTLVPVVHRPTGRVGIELDLGRGGWSQRGVVLAELAALAVARADHPVLQLAADAHLDTRLGGLQIVLWLVAPPATPLPGDGGIEGGVSTALLEALRGGALFEDLELHVLPHDAAAHDEVVSAISKIAEAAGWLGGPPRWVEGPQGLRFCPTWRLSRDQLQPVLGLGQGPGVAGIRIVPGEPSGLAEGWPIIQPSWRWAGARCLVRLRDARTDRDLLERVEERSATPQDHEIADRLEGWSRPVVDRRGRPGLELIAGPEVASEAGLRALLQEMSAVDHPALLPTGTWGYTPEGARIRLWYRASVRPGPRVWRGQPPPPPPSPPPSPVGARGEPGSDLPWSG